MRATRGGSGGENLATEVLAAPRSGVGAKDVRGRRRRAVRLALSALSCPIRAQVSASRRVLPARGRVALLPEKRTIKRNVPCRTPPPSEFHSAHYERHARAPHSRYLHKQYGG